MRNIDNPHSRGEVSVTCKDDLVPLVYFDCILMENYVTVVVTKCPSDRSAPDVGAGMICPLRAVGLISSNGKSHVWAEIMLVPLGCKTVMGVVAIFLLIIGVFSMT